MGSVLPAPPGQDAARWPKGPDPRFSLLILSSGALGREEKHKEQRIRSETSTGKSRTGAGGRRPRLRGLALSPAPFLAARGSVPAWTRTPLLGRRWDRRRGARASFAAELGYSCKSPKWFCSVSQGPGAAERPALGGSSRAWCFRRRRKLLWGGRKSAAAFHRLQLTVSRGTGALPTPLSPPRRSRAARASPRPRQSSRVSFPAGHPSLSASTLPAADPAPR